MLDFWYASYLFLALSLSIGVMVWLIVRSKKARKRKQSSVDRLLSETGAEQDKTPLQQLEDEYGKKG
jgi:heme exporter protein D